MKLLSFMLKSGNTSLLFSPSFMSVHLPVISGESAKIGVESNRCLTAISWQIKLCTLVCLSPKEAEGPEDDGSERWLSPPRGRTGY